MNFPLNAFYCTLLVSASLYFFWTGHGVAMEQQKSHIQELQDQIIGEATCRRFLEETLATPAPSPMASLDVCETSNINTFETDVDVDFLGDPDTFSLTEMKALEIAFLSSFNNLAVTYCDPLFRSIIDVESIGLVNPPVLSRMRSLATVTTRFQWRYRVNIRCKGCPSDTKLFNDALLRRRTQEATFFDEQCLCPVDFIDDRSPTIEEFLLLYNETINTLDLENIDSVADAVELTLTFSPTSPPSESLATAPTKKPTKKSKKKGTRRPTKKPKKSPTLTPAQVGNEGANTESINNPS